MKSFSTLLLCTLFFNLMAQGNSIKGQLQDDSGDAVIFANVGLYNVSDSALVKVETSNEAGIFKFMNIPDGNYYLIATHIGSNDLLKPGISVQAGQELDLGVLMFQSSAIELETAMVTATRAIVEIKPDRTVFNVQGTINSVGSDGLDLLRKAPGVLVDNNDNINLLGRSGVLVYVDGKRLPLTGEDLSTYIRNLTAEQIDHIDIITSPGARYEAEGNAGIIDIRLKKDKRFGANGNVSLSSSQGQYNQRNANIGGNYRNKFFNAFGNAGWGEGQRFNKMVFGSYQNGLFMDEINNHTNIFNNYNYQAGIDFYLSENHTVGVLVGGGMNEDDRNALNKIWISRQDAILDVDSVLVARSLENSSRMQQTYNLNYRFDNKKGRILNVDADYGNYDNESTRYQPNLYYNPEENQLLTEIINSFDTPRDIDIYTFKVDFEEKIAGGVLGLGTKYSKVVSDNTFLFFDEINDQPIRNNYRSNIFVYDENVYAAYINYSRPIGQKWNFSAGLRAEQTDAVGDLQAFIPELEEPKVNLNYLNWFPSGGLTWNVAPAHTLSLNYGRRINRPDYDVLNPFKNQISQLSYFKGNPFLRPEIVNNLELGYTLKYRYNFKIGYSKTFDQITRLMAPDEQDPRAGFLTWENLSEQTIYSMNISAPVQLAKWWNAYFNFSGSHINNQADYGNGAIVDIQAFTYNIYQQHTFNLPFKFTGEISGYYSGPGIWGGVFEYESNWGLDLGLQRKFLNDQLNVRLSAKDLFYENGWDGMSNFSGLETFGSGRWDSRRVGLSLNYQFGNQNVKSRKRKTGLEDEERRVGG